MVHVTLSRLSQLRPVVACMWFCACLVPSAEYDPSLAVDAGPEPVTAGQMSVTTAGSGGRRPMGGSGGTLPTTLKGGSGGTGGGGSGGMKPVEPNKCGSATCSKKSSAPAGLSPAEACCVDEDTSTCGYMVNNKCTPEATSARLCPAPTAGEKACCVPNTNMCGADRTPYGKGCVVTTQTMGRMCMPSGPVVTMMPEYDAGFEDAGFWSGGKR